MPFYMVPTQQVQEYIINIVTTTKGPKQNLFMMPSPNGKKYAIYKASSPEGQIYAIFINSFQKGTKYIKVTIPTPKCLNN